MKNIITKRLLSAVVTLLLTSFAVASDYTDGNGIEYTLDASAKTATVVAKTNGTYSGAITIPATVTSNNVTYSVTAIGEKALYDQCAKITSISIPASIKTIGNNVFNGSSNSTRVGIDKVYITDMEAWCNIDFASAYGYSSPFYYYNGSSTSKTKHLYLNGTEVTELTIPEGVTTISPCAFSFCRNIKKVTIPKSVTEIKWSAFNQCTGLTEVNISDMKVWCEMTFGQKANPLSATTNARLYLNGELVTELVIPEGTTKVRGKAFYGYTKLTSVSFPTTLTSIGKRQ